MFSYYTCSLYAPGRLLATVVAILQQQPAVGQATLCRMAMEGGGGTQLQMLHSYSIKGRCCSIQMRTMQLQSIGIRRNKLGDNSSPSTYYVQYLRIPE